MRPGDLFAGPSNGLGGGDTRLCFQFPHRPGVVAREGRDRVPGLLCDVGQTAPLPEQQRDERAPKTVRAQITGDPRLDRGRAPDAPAPVGPVLTSPLPAGGTRDDQVAVLGATTRRPPLSKVLCEGRDQIDVAGPAGLGRKDVERAVVQIAPPEAWQEMAKAAAATTREQLDQDYGFAAYEWEVALEQSRMAPPDARFASRMRHIAEAAARRAATIRECMDDAGFGWTPIPGSAEMTLSYELRPGGIRPGPKDAWDRFDRVVARLGIAMEGSSASAVAGALGDLANAMNDLAVAIENRPARAGEVRASEATEDRGGVD